MVLLQSAQPGAASWPAQLWTGPGAIHLVCHTLKVCPPDGCEQRASQLDWERDGSLDGQTDSFPPGPPLPLTGRDLGDERHWRPQDSVRGWLQHLQKQRHRCVPCAASMAFRGGIMKEDFPGPFPCENLTGCTFPWGSRAGQNMQPQHDLGGAFQGSWSCSVCPIPGLSARG